MRYLLILLLVVVSPSQLSAQEKQTKIEFLGMRDSCKHSSEMWLSLHEAMKELRWNIPIDSLDLNDLSEKKDIRAGYGSPSILINGEDLFGAKTPTTFEPACRLYEGGIPKTTEIVEKLSLFKPPAKAKNWRRGM